MKTEIINVSKQLMLCSGLLFLNQFLIRFGMDTNEWYWTVGIYCFLASTWLVLLSIGILAFVNIVQLLERLKMNYSPEPTIMIPLISSITKLCGITGLILWV